MRDDVVTTGLFLVCAVVTIPSTLLGAIGNFVEEGLMSRAATLAAITDATPASRDRYVDLLRALSIGVVVFGHWLSAIVYERHGRLEGGSALDLVPGLWILTWVLQVMPIFFFVGGFSNQLSWDSTVRKGAGYRSFLASRVDRLMKPTCVFIVVWLAAGMAVRLVVPDSVGPLGLALEVVARPLWFLAVYVLVIALAPLMLTLHRRHGVRVLIVLVLCALAADVARIGAGWIAVGYLNFVFVWLFAHQLGFFYADGALAATRRAAAAMAVTGLTTLVALVGTGVYALSMVGTESDKASNNTPPTVCLIALTIWLVGLALFFKSPATRWLSTRAAWSAVVAANSMIMTVFLWHLTSVLLAALVLVAAGWDQPQPGSALFWAWRPLWIAMLLVFLAPFVVAFRRFERPGPARSGSARTALPTGKVVTAIACLVAGLGGLASFGFDTDVRVLGAALPLPFLSAGLAVAGHRILARGRAATA